MARQTCAVFGLGQFGRACVEELHRLGFDIIAIDTNEESVSKISEFTPTAFIADSTDSDALRQLKIKDVDIAIVAYGHNLESTIMTTALLKEIGVPRVIVRVDDDHYINIVKKVGADEIVSPQRAAGIAVCNRLVNDDFRDFYKLNGKYSVVLIEVNEAFEKTTLAELNAKKLYGVSVLLIIRDKDSFVPGGTDEILPGDNIYVVGTSKEIKAFRESINGKKVIKK